MSADDRVQADQAAIGAVLLTSSAIFYNLLLTARKP